MNMRLLFRVSCPGALQIVFLCALFVITGSRLNAQTPAGVHPAQVKPVQTKEYSYKIIQTLENTYGYDIYRNGKLLIHQTSIPAVEGNKGFASEAAAQRVAKLVISKIRGGDMPPSITIEDLKKLKAI